MAPAEGGCKAWPPCLPDCPAPGPPITLVTLKTTLTVSSLPISQQQLQIKLEGLISCLFHPGLTDWQEYFVSNNWTSKKDLMPRKETQLLAPCYTPTSFLVERTVSVEPQPHLLKLKLSPHPSGGGLEVCWPADLLGLLHLKNGEYIPDQPAP